MGVKYGRDVLHSLIGLTIWDVAEICKMMAFDKETSSPVMDADCSNLRFKVGSRDARSVANHLTKWSLYGLHMTPVCDGDVRPVCKHATNARKASREKDRIKAHELRTGILALNRKLKFDSLSDNERSLVVIDIDAKQKAMKTKETQSRNTAPANFNKTLVEELEVTDVHSRNDAGGLVTTALLAEFQANAVMMGRVVSGTSMMVMTNDADIPILAGDSCVTVKEYTKDGAVELVTTSRATLEYIIHCLACAQINLPEEEKGHPTPQYAAFPIFDGITDRHLRATMMLILGCDVYVKGVPNIGTSKLNDIINIAFPRFQACCPAATLRGYLKKHVVVKHIDNFDDTVVRTYLRALVYEPTNVTPECVNRVIPEGNNRDIGEEMPEIFARNHGDSDSSDDGSDAKEGQDRTSVFDRGHRTYLDNPPTKFPKYLEEFSAPQTEIFDGPEIMECKGIAACPHKFLKADGFDECTSCHGIVCMHCRGCLEDNIYCLSYYAAKLLVPSDTLEGGLQIQSMRHKLDAKWGVERAGDMTIEEVEDLYEL